MDTETYVRGWGSHGAGTWRHFIPGTENNPVREEVHHGLTFVWETHHDLRLHV